jgi:hypothetical protein
MGIDLPADFSGNVHQQARQLSQSDITDDHKIDVAGGLFLLSGERPKYEGDPDACFVAEGIYDDIRKSACLEDEGADFGVNGMRSVCPIVNTIPVSHPGDAGASSVPSARCRWQNRFVAQSLACKALNRAQFRRDCEKFPL